MTTTATRTTRRLVTLAEAAEFLGVHTRTVRRRIADGTITGYRIGGAIRVDMAEVESALRVIPTTARAGAR